MKNSSRGRASFISKAIFGIRRRRRLFRKAAEAAHRSGARVALTLSDAFCVDRYRDEFALDSFAAARSTLFSPTRANCTPFTRPRISARRLPN